MGTSVLGLANERFFPLYGTEALDVEFAAAANRRRQALGLAPNAPLPEMLWRVGHLDAVAEGDTGNNFQQLIFALETGARSSLLP